MSEWAVATGGGTGSGGIICTTNLSYVATEANAVDTRTRHHIEVPHCPYRRYRAGLHGCLCSRTARMEVFLTQLALPSACAAASQPSIGTMALTSTAAPLPSPRRCS